MVLTFETESDYFEIRSETRMRAALGSAPRNRAGTSGARSGN